MPKYELPEVAKDKKLVAAIEAKLEQLPTHPSAATRALSIVPAEQHKAWFQQIWTGLTGASTREHPAPYPLQLAERLIRMFSFAGDTVFDPFMGTGTTNVAAAKWGRNSVGVEVDERYFDMAVKRIDRETPKLLASDRVVHLHN